MGKNSLVAALAVLLLVPCLHAHSLHQSTAEAEYNPKTQALEVSLTIFIDDLETALIRRTERSLRMEQTPTAVFDAQILAYLGTVFTVTNGQGSAVKINWLGRQVDKESRRSSDPTATLFFQFALPHGLDGATIRHALFCDLFEDQINLLLLKDGDDKRTLKFQPGDTFKPLRAPR